MNSPFPARSSTLVGDSTARAAQLSAHGGRRTKSRCRAWPTRAATRASLSSGDSIFLGNQYIEAGANRDFLGYAVNWLLDRTALLEGIGPRPVTEFRLHDDAATSSSEVRWLLLGALPGGCCCLAGWSGWCAENNELENHMESGS